MTESGKKIGFWGACSYMIGSIVDSGIFITPTLILKHAGSIELCLIVWVICGLLALLGALCYIELGTSIPRSGSDYVYLMSVDW